MKLSDEVEGGEREEGRNTKGGDAREREVIELRSSSKKAQNALRTLL